MPVNFHETLPLSKNTFCYGQNLQTSAHLEQSGFREPWNDENMECWGDLVLSPFPFFQYSGRINTVKD